jgi:CRP/FNR family cyclic AMP-dependent transcriptional regulator
MDCARVFDTLTTRILNGKQPVPEGDLEKLSRFDAFSWLSTYELGLLAGTLATTDFERPQVILREAEPASRANILLKGIVRVSCQNTQGKRVTVALLAPGPIPEFPSPPLSPFTFRCEAYDDCRVGTLRWSDFDGITAHGAELAFRKFHENAMRQWYRLLLRNPSFLNVNLYQRVAITLLELASDFGIKEARGMLLRASFSHQDIADLVGATRPRVTEQLAQLEQEKLIIRQGRRLIIRVQDLAALTDRICPAPRAVPVQPPLSPFNSSAFLAQTKSHHAWGMN